MMELVINKGFYELVDNDIFEIVGGTSTAGRMVMVIGGAVVAGVVAPLTCGGSLAAYASLAGTGYGMMVMGGFDW